MRRRTWLWIAFGTVCLAATIVTTMAKPPDDFALVRQRYHPAITTGTGGTVHYVFPVTVSEDDVRRDLGAAPGLVACSDGCGELTWLPDGLEVDLSFSNGGGCCELDVPPDARPWYERWWETLKRRFSHP